MLIPREQLPFTLTQILNKYPVKDLEITDPPIEEIIGEMFSLDK